MPEPWLGWQGDVVTALQIPLRTAVKVCRDIAECHSQRSMPTLLRGRGVLAGRTAKL